MGKRRPNGDGTIRKRSDGRWEGRYISGRNELGKGYSINIQLNMDYEQFCEGWMGK